MSVEEGQPERLRLFFAVPLPNEVRAALAHLCPQPSVPGAGAYRWIEVSLLHVTLVFLGSQPATDVDRLAAIAESAARSCQPGRLTLGEAGSFGPRRAPRVLWVGLAGDVPLLAGVHGALAGGLRSAGYVVEDRPFSPHITLARRREAARPSDVLDWPPCTPQHLHFALDRFDLMRSELSRAGARYTSLRSFALGAP